MLNSTIRAHDSKGLIGLGIKAQGLAIRVLASQNPMPSLLKLKEDLSA